MNNKLFLSFKIIYVLAPIHSAIQKILWNYLPAATVRKSGWVVEYLLGTEQVLAKLIYGIYFFLGWWTRHCIIGNYLCISRTLLYVRAYDYDQEVYCQMDYGCIHFLLFFIYCRSILSRILHLDPRSYNSRSRSSTYVECQVYLFISGLFQ